MAGAVGLANLLVGLSDTGAVRQTNAETTRAFACWQESCPHRTRANSALKAITANDPSLELKDIELGRASKDATASVRSIQDYPLPRASVPLAAPGLTDGDHLIGSRI